MRVSSIKRVATHRLTLLLILAAFFMVSFAGACIGSAKEVPPGHIGALVGSDGLSDKVLQPGKFRLPARCSWFGSQCDRLILAEVSDFRDEQTLSVFMPQDQLTLTVQVSGQFTIDANRADMLYSRIVPEPYQKGKRSDGTPIYDGSVTIILRDKVFDTYAEQAVIEQTRNYLRKFSIDEVLQNAEEIGDELTRILRGALTETPVKLVQFGFANLTPPDIILTANERAKEREIAIEEAKAEKLVALEQATARFEVAEVNQDIDLLEAETQMLVNQKLAESTSQAFIAQRTLAILLEMAKSDNKVFVVPTEFINSGGLAFAVFNDTE